MGQTTPKLPGLLGRCGRSYETVTEARAKPIDRPLTDEQKAEALRRFRGGSSVFDLVFDMDVAEVALFDVGDPALTAAVQKDLLDGI